jgi:hypothetical protein
MHDESSASRVPVCRICHQPVVLNEAKTDEDGKAVHEGCYVTKIHLVQSRGDQTVAQSRVPRESVKPKRSSEN